MNYNQIIACSQRFEGLDPRAQSPKNHKVFTMRAEFIAEMNTELNAELNAEPNADLDADTS